MLYVDIPTLPEFRALATTRADACISLYLPTTVRTQDTPATRTRLKVLGKAALDQLADSGFDKRRQAIIEDHLAELAEDAEFWRFQAHSLAVLVTPETIRTFRLPNRLTAMAEVSDRSQAAPAGHHLPPRGVRAGIVGKCGAARRGVRRPAGATDQHP